MLLSIAYSFVKMVYMKGYCKCVIWVLENLGIWHFSVLESPSKQCWNFCANPTCPSVYPA